MLRPVTISGSTGAFASAPGALQTAAKLVQQLPPLGGDRYVQADIVRAMSHEMSPGLHHFFADLAGPNSNAAKSAPYDEQIHGPVPDQLPRIPRLFKWLQPQHRELAGRTYHALLPVLNLSHTLPTLAWFDLSGGVLGGGERPGDVLQGDIVGAMGLAFVLGMDVGLISYEKRQMIDGLARRHPFLNDVVYRTQSKRVFIMDRSAIAETGRTLTADISGLEVVDATSPGIAFRRLNGDNGKGPPFAQIPPFIASGEIYITIQPHAYDALSSYFRSCIKPAEGSDFMTALNISRSNTFVMQRGMGEVSLSSAFAAFLAGVNLEHPTMHSAFPNDRVRRAVTPQPLLAVRAAMSIR